MRRVRCHPCWSFSRSLDGGREPGSLGGCFNAWLSGTAYLDVDTRRFRQTLILAGSRHECLHHESVLGYHVEHYFMAPHERQGPGRVVAQQARRAHCPHSARL